MTSGPAEVFDLGYHGYEGERTGRWARRGAIWRDGIRTALGLGRGVGAKVAPWLLLGLALVPMVVLVVVAAFVGPATDPDDFELPSYGDYYEWAMVPLGLFAAVVAPRIGIMRGVLLEASSLTPDAMSGVQPFMPEAIGVLAGYFARQMEAGTVRRMDPILAVQAVLGPVFIHLLTRPIAERLVGFDVPMEDAVESLVATILEGLAA